jgi:spore coat protein U-like protein
MNWRRVSSVSRAIAVLCLLLFAKVSFADTVCRIVSGGGIAFGSYDIFSPAPNDSLVNINITCSRTGGPQTVLVTMRLSPGANSTSATGRQMQRIGGAGDYLAYGLYRDVSRSSANVWGFSDGIDTSSMTLNIPNNASASATFTIYGRIPPQQDAAAGSYSDTVLLTLVP